ncbi:hypothetical protein KVR01_008895 [Diaporthe batatas]|uniref:uncharacterized protein n=1 Tax=Diaporthe batatas TaxID=748121 RepID=UPI001D04617F|nr:uncharacterized protein KVR01_008895 [Diaporthe batatas]KAG8160631.1 hypothetical protein KVR01_008895 [Diaporthe batatas]
MATTALEASKNTTTVISVVSENPDMDEIVTLLQKDEFLIEWQGPSDKGNPQNLPIWRKWLITMTLALLVLTTTFSSAVFSVAANAISQEYGVAVETAVFGGTSLFMLGFAVGPIIFGTFKATF